MAKQQTFGDKLKKKKETSKISVKVIKWYKDSDRGTMRTLERFVNVNDLSEVDKLDINR
jgi:hypothetical protein